MGSPLINLWSGEQPDIVGDDTEATLTLKNTSSGNALSISADSGSSGTGLNIDVDAGTGSALDAISDNTSWAARIQSGANAAPALILGFSGVLGSATIAPLRLVASAASQAFIQFQGVFLSSASYGVANAFVVPVYHATQNVWGFIGASKGL